MFMYIVSIINTAFANSNQSFVQKCSQLTMDEGDDFCQILCTHSLKCSNFLNIFFM